MSQSAKSRTGASARKTGRKCPGEKYEISPAICNARQANSYPKCLLCSFYSGLPDDYATGDPKIKKSIFRSSVIAGEVPEDINEYVMRKVGTAAGQYLKTRSGGKGAVAIACDRRDNSRNLSRIFGEGLESAGMHALHLGPALPDMLRFAIKEHGLSAAAFISGCNARLEVNGIRIIDGNGSPVLYNTGIEKIGLIARRLKANRSPSHGRSDTLRILPEYRDFLIAQTPPLQPLTVVIDGSNGIGGEIMPYVLGKTPLTAVRSHCEPDGRSELLGLRFPSGQVNTSVQQAIRANSAHLGMAADYDGDLCFFYDEKGQLLRSDVAAAVIARELLMQKPGTKVAYDLRSTAALREDVLRAGGELLRASPTPGGLSDAVIDGGAEYAFDIGGRHAFKALSAGESPLLALMLLCCALQRKQAPLSELAADVQRYAYSGMTSHEMPTPEEAAAAVESLLTQFTEHELDDAGGLFFKLPNCWFHIDQKPRSRIINICIEGRTDEDEKNARRAIEQIINRHRGRQ